MDVKLNQAGSPVTKTINENSVWTGQTACSHLQFALLFFFFLDFCAFLSTIIRNNGHALLEIESRICSASGKEQRQEKDWAF